MIIKKDKVCCACQWRYETFCFFFVFDTSYKTVLRTNRNIEGELFCYKTMYSVKIALSSCMQVRMVSLSSAVE